MKKTYLLGLLILAGTAGIFSVYSINNVKADYEDTQGTLIDRIISKFNLNKTDVEKVVTDYRSEKQAARITVVETKLTEAVSAGKITEDQKAKILAKIKYWQESKTNWQNLTKEERRNKMEEHRADMEALEKELGINIHDIIGLGFGNGKKGGNGGFGYGRKLD
jgi:hypothetical protein